MPDKKGASRQARLASLLHREIATCVQQELRDPRLGFITVIRVEVSADLHQVKAFYTVLGDLAQRKLAAKALEQARGFVQNSYAGVVKTRLLPTLSFAYDDAEERRHSMDDLIRQARSTDTDGGSTPTPPSPDATKATGPDPIAP